MLLVIVHQHIRHFEFTVSRQNSSEFCYAHKNEDKIATDLKAIAITMYGKGRCGVAKKWVISHNNS